jgi:glutamate 5-kinase
MFSVGHASKCVLNPKNFGSVQRISSPQQSQPMDLQGVLKSDQSQTKVIYSTIFSYRDGIVVDRDALNAVRAGAKLFPVGVLRVRGRFSAGDQINIFNHQGLKIGECKAVYSSYDIRRIKGKHSREIIQILGINRGESVISNIQL